MKKLLLFILCCTIFSTKMLYAQNRTVTGIVTAKEDGTTLPGVGVTIKGTQVGTTTNNEGRYSISVPATAQTLVFTYIGYASKEVRISGSSVNVVLISDTRELGEVIVTTSLGIKRQAKELGYSTATVDAKELTKTNVTNIANGLTAKVAGLQVNTVNNGIDPSTRITLRGNRSINNNNNALIVLDGVPIPNGTLNSINPNDIDNVSILKGAGAAALYGSEASNGAIILTTKKGTANGAPIIKYSNSLQLSQVSYFPELQTKFGLYGGETVADGYRDPLTGAPIFTEYENQLYGPAYDGTQKQLGAPLQNGEKNIITYSAKGENPVQAFFQTGIVEQNDLSYQSGDVDNSFYASAQNVFNKGITPEDRNKRSAFRLSGSKKYGIFRANFSVSYTNNSVSTYGNNYSTNATATALYPSVMQLPAFLTVADIKDATNGKFSNPNDYYSAYSINPYWQIQNSRVTRNADVILGNLNLNLTPTKWFDISYTLAQNYGINNFKSIRREQVFSAYALSDPLGVSNYPSRYRAAGKAPGFVQDYTQFGDGTTNLSFGNNQGLSRLQQDFLLKFHHTFFDDFKADLLLGNTIWQAKARTQSDQSNNLLVPDFYNIAFIGGNPTISQADYFIRQIGVFGSFNLSYKGFASLEVTGRNDWDSRLPQSNRSFFYPSVKGAFVFTDAIEALRGNRILTYGKLRASFSKVGQVSIGPYSINNVYANTSGFPYGGLGGLSLSSTANNPTLKPEIVTEREFGAELGLFDSRLNVGATYYKSNSRNQTLSIGTSASSGFQNATVNAGELQNTGYEFELNLAALQERKHKVGLNIGGNLGIYDNKVLSLLPGSDQFPLAGGVGNVFAVVGQPFPLLLGSDYVRDPQGRVVVNSTGTTAGYPSVSPTLTNYGRTTPKYVLGLNFSAKYKFVTLSAVAEYKTGFVIYNAVGSTLNFAGSSQYSALADRQRFIFPNSVIQTSPGVYAPNTSIAVIDGNYGFWQSSQFNSAISPFVNSAAFWKLREVNLAFDLTKFIDKTRFVKGLTLAFTGRNLLMFRPKDNIWTDPEFSADNSNAVGVTNSAQLPPTRLYGANLQVTF